MFTQTYPRRRFLRASATAMLGLSLWPGRARAEENGQGESGWSFLAVNDLHFHDAACGPWFEKVVAAMKASAPEAEFCLLGGDQSDEAQPAQLAGVRDAFKALGLPCYATPGNHDCSAEGSRHAYDEVFPGQVNKYFDHRGWQILGLDTTDGPKYHDTTIQPDTFAWLDLMLPKLSRSQPTILWTHFPLGAGVKYRPDNADALLQRLADYNIQAGLSGHWHGLTETPWRETILTTDRCCSRVRYNHDSTTEKGWFVCRAEAGKITRTFVEIPADLRTPAPAS